MQLSGQQRYARVVVILPEAKLEFTVDQPRLSEKHFLKLIMAGASGTRREKKKDYMHVRTTLLKNHNASGSSFSDQPR